MKILHCCLANFYIDNYGYQENILPRMHKLQGHEVYIIASTETYLSKGVLGYVPPSSYLSKDGIPVTRVPYIKWLPKILQRKLRIYRGVKNLLEDFNPDIIFMHDCQTYSVIEIANYIKKNSHVKLFVDSHTDYINSARGFISKNILHGIIYKWYVRQIIPYAEKFYGTLPIRVDFYTQCYGTPRNKTEYLPMGVDATNIDFSQRKIIRKEIRENFGLSETDFVLISGGKIDKRKNIHLLIQAVERLNIKNLSLILFGIPTLDIEDEINLLLNNSQKIISIGWINSNDTYKYFFASDLAVFPGSHSTLWEEALGLGIPAIFKRWKGMEHIDLGGNCVFLDDVTIESISNTISQIAENRTLYGTMRNKALQKENMNKFNYYEIAQRAIEQ